MSSPQIKKKNKIIILFIFIIFFGLFNNVKEAKAVNILGGTGKLTCPKGMFSKENTDLINTTSDIGALAQAINVQDIEVLKQLISSECTAESGIIKSVMDQITTWTIDKAWKELLNSGALAWRQALKFFLNNLAYDMATYLATGDKGQLPMFETEGWGGYLKNVADNTAGAFIEELGKNMGTLKFNLCQPNLDVMLRINLGLERSFRPIKPSCTFSQLINNWDAALNDKDFLPKFQDMFNPWSNDLGIALTLQTGIESEISRKVNEAAHDRLEGEGFKPVSDAISGMIKTPVQLVKQAAGLPLEKSTASEELFTDHILADSIDIFINTLIGKLIDKWLKKGLVTDFPANIDRFNNLGSNSLTDPDAQKSDEGIAGAASRFRSLIEPNFKVRGDYNILAELAMCPDPNKAGPTNCVIDEKFREAIEKRLTVKQAMDQGYLSANGVFGFMSDGLEPKYNEGYPYRSMLILRKFRIIPVGWEIAAQYIKDCQSQNVDSVKCSKGEAGGAKNLKNLVDCFSNAAPAWCAGLVDLNWVLKAPQNFCAREGAGPEILSEQVTGEGSGSSLSILRNDVYCADEKSLIKENSDGSNPYYGYCTEERRIWDFNAKSCAPRDNTCQTFQSEDQTVSYLQNTLDFGVCNAGNAGCAKYATNGSYINDAVVWSGNNNPIYLNKQAESCDAVDQGCYGFIRITPGQDETYNEIKNAGIDKAYQRFSASGLIYEKLLPNYLKDVCYDNQGRLKISAPAQCSNFVRECKEIEAGCELYASVIDGFKIPAKVQPIDYCPAECVGYDTFVQKETTFASSREAYFIPKTAKTCSAESSGCDEFTNLEKIATTTPNVAEQKEYYTYLRQCLKPDTAGKFCGEFYNWEGSDESGYQLKVAGLESTSADDNGEPVLTVIYDPAKCDQTIYNSPVGDPRHNDDCRQFYNRVGDIFYRLYSNTKDCSDNCHPYRRTELNIDENITEANCLGAADKHWTGEKCVVCKSGGVWSDDNNACIYMAIPGQGAACPAAQNGCREYNGNAGNDVRNIFTDGFSGGTVGGWAGVNGSLVTPSSEALTLDSDNKGNSLSVSGGSFSARRLVGNSVIQGKAYVLSFLVKAAAKTNLNIFLAASADGARAEFTQIKDAGTDWQIYKTNLTNLNHKVTADEFLLIEAGQNFYIDNITLTEIVDRYYLIKQSWQTPSSCDQETDGTPHDQYMLPCDQYQNRAGKTHNLRQFSELCSESAVGCELMIDTKNSNSPVEETFTNDGTTKTVPADSFTYVVYDQDKLCNQEVKGCALLGKSYKYENDTLYGDVYLKNNPDKYNQILCGADAVGCKAFAYNDGVKSGEKYFKDPGDQACEWRRQAGAGDHEGWFKKKIKRCQPEGLAGGGDNGAICLSDANCTGGAKCQIETADRFCPTADDKTLGLGGAGGKVSQPTVETLSNGTKVNWAGICAAANSGCGEYIDPVSRFNANIIFNGSFANLDNNINTIDGWGAGITQNVTLKPNTVYRLAAEKNNSGSPVSLKINCLNNSSLYVINEDNELSASPRSDVTVMASNARNSRIFYYRDNDEVSCTVSVGNDKGVVELKPAVISYQLAQNLDKKSCNGLVDFNKGCVLFNERNYDFASLKKLNSDADASSFGSASENEEDSNVILKVTPDRVCGKWLACRSYAKDEKDNNICYGVGLCDAVDNKGDCLSFIASSKTNQTIESLGADKISNLSGYAKVGLQGGSLGGDYYPLGAMEQKGEVVNLANGGFEFYGANNYPLGWTWGGQAAVNKPWDINVFSVINNPIAAQTEGIGYAREGRAFLKLGSSYDAMSEETDVLPQTDYIITAYVNTKNLKSGQVMIDIINKNNAVIKSAVIAQTLGNDWQLQIGKFNSDNNSTIKIKLYASLSGGRALTSSEGNFYFDDVKIKPALNSKDNWYTAQSCRLYPKTDSLSCDYFEDSGKRQKGLPGYCLEYDRPPGNPNACILWYPIDRVKGDGIEEGGWYQGKFPVYYCLSASAVGCGVDGKALIKCDKVVRTVNSIGQNKYWSSHVYQGSDWFTANQDDSYINYDNTGLNKVDVGADDKQYNYSYDQTPFGSIAPPFNAIDNPFDWDSRAASGIQPLYLEVPPKGQSNLARAGSPFYCNADQSCYLMEFHNGRTFQINSLEVEVFMSAVCGNACSLSFNGISHPNGWPNEPNGWAKQKLIIGDNTIFLYSDAAGKSSGKGRCTNKMKAYIVLPNGEKAALTKAGNETKTGGSAITDCGDDSVDGGSAINYADGSFTTTFKVTYNDHKECKVNVNEGEAEAINRVKKLFAKSYGAWEWNDKAEICVGGAKAGVSCKTDYDCQSSCQGNCFYTPNPNPSNINSVNSNLTCDIHQVATSSCSGLSKGLCVNIVCRSDKTCSSGSKVGQPCNNNANCSENVCIGGHKNLSACNIIGSNECKGCASQTFGICNRVSQCQGGANDGKNCNSGGTAFCNNSCAGFNIGDCLNTNPDVSITTLKCVGGNKAGNSCGENICQADSYGLKTCASGSKIGKYCSNNNDCDDCKGCAGNTYGVCELLGQCQNGARNGLICDLSQGDSQCNSLTADLSTSNCGGAGYNQGDCVQKKICESGCNKGSVCSNVFSDSFNDSGLCESTECNECRASYCSDDRPCSSNAACSGTCGSIGYKPVFQPAWGPPGTLTNNPIDFVGTNNGLCLNNIRPKCPSNDCIASCNGSCGNQYCAILPQVSNIKVQDKAGGLVKLTTSQFINLTFNSKVDSQQLPLVMYAIDWGDNEKTVITGAEMRDRPEASGNPHSLYHLYSYWDLKTKANSGITGIDCLIPGKCKVNLKIQIKDNWGWCNKGQTINVCDVEQWDYFGGTIVVKEK